MFFLLGLGGRRVVFGGFSKRTFHFVVWIGGDGLRIAPEPAHDLRKNCAALFLAVIADTPGIIEVVAPFCERLGHPNVLVEPIVRARIRTGTSSAAVVIAAVLEVNAQRFLFRL